MIEAFCECGNKMVIFPHHAGTTLPCPKCGEGVEVPVPEGGVPSYDAPPEPEEEPGLLMRILEKIAKKLVGD